MIQEYDLRSAIMDAITDVWDRTKQIDDAADKVLDLIEADRKQSDTRTSRSVEQLKESLKTRNQRFVATYSEVKNLIEYYEAKLKHTADLISTYQKKVLALEAENFCLVSDLDDLQCSDFWVWIRRAYREPESAAYTIYNMEVAYQAGCASAETDRKRRGEPVTTRRAFVCTSCEGVYADQPVSRCDCMPEKDEFIEGTISYPRALIARGEPEKCVGCEGSPSSENSPCGVCGRSVNSTHTLGKLMGYINPDHIGQGHGSGIFWVKDQNFNKPVYEAPQSQQQSRGEPFAWATHHDEPMLFPTHQEAQTYCEDGENPIALYVGSQPHQQVSEPVAEVIKDTYGSYSHIKWKNGYKAEVGHKFYLAPQPQQAPEGYKIVPIEPTEKMIEVGCADYDISLRQRYKLMLEAAPEPKEHT